MTEQETEQARVQIARIPFVEFVAVQVGCEFINTDLIMFRHKAAPRGAVVALRQKDFNDLNIMLSAAAQLGRYRRTNGNHA